MFTRTFRKILCKSSSRRRLSLLGFMIFIVVAWCLILRNHNSIQQLADSQSRTILSSMSGGQQRARVKRLPQAIIIGCRKSGTRALLRFLEINPAVRVAQREVHFFDTPSNFKLGLNWYRDQMPETLPHELGLEKSPAYFVGKNVPERISAMNSSVKLVVIFRQPVTRLISDFSQLVANKLDAGAAALLGDIDGGLDNIKDEEPVNLSGTVSSNSSSLGDASRIWLEAEKKLEEYILRPDGGIDDQQRAIRIGMYSVYLERWLSVFSREQMHFVNGETLVTDPAVELQKLELFLGLKPFIRREHFVFDAKKGFYCLNGTLSYMHANRPPLSGAEMEPHCLNKSKGRRHVRLRRQLREKLQDFYGPYNEYLYALTGINFDSSE